jgi:uncharacterized protein (DUF1330 family)
MQEPFRCKVVPLGDCINDQQHQIGIRLGARKRETMPGYVISRLTIRDREAMQRYIVEASETVAAFGGRYLVRGVAVKALEGRWEDDRMVVVQFTSREAALAWFDCDDYRPLRELRRGAAEAVALIADGVDGQPP